MKSNLGATDLEICKTCLAMDVKLYSLQKKLLKDCNKVLTKFIKDINGLPDYMCYQCVALLIKTHNFIQKSIYSKNTLVNIHKEYGVLTKDLVSNINKSELSTNSSLTFNKMMPTTIYDMQYDEDLNKYNYIIITKNDNDNNMNYDEINNTEVQTNDVPLNFINLDGIKNDNCEVMITDGDDHDRSNIGKDDKEDLTDDGSYDSEENLTLNSIINEAKIQKLKKKKPILNGRIKKTPNSSNAQEINLEKYFKIVKLTLEEQIADHEKMKESPAYRDALYRCEVCYRTYMNPDSYKQHVGQHHPSRGSHECPVCKIRYTSGSLARCHATRAHGKKFYCKICPKRFVTANMAKKHHQRHEGRTYKCSDCDFSSIHESAVYSHIKTLHGNRFSCTECGYKFRSEKGLRLHVAKIHGIKQTSKVDTLFICYNCDTNFISEAMLQKHSINCRLKVDGEDKGERSENGRYGVLNTTEDHYPIQCEHCGLSMNTRKEHYFHVRKYHRNELVSYQPVITAVCTTCGRGFQNSTKLHMHELRHLGTATVHCPHCPRMFYDKYQLARHIGVHSTDRPYKCTECDKTFKLKSNMSRHQQRRRGPHCPRMFYDKYQLARHIGVHSTDRPYKCTECDKTFKLKSNMSRHQQVHSSAFPHECNMCGKRFSYTSSRNLHIKTVHYKMPQPPRKKRNTKSARNSAVNSYDNY